MVRVRIRVRVRWFGCEFGFGLLMWLGLLMCSTCVAPPAGSCAPAPWHGVAPTHPLPRPRLLASPLLASPLLTHHGLGRGHGDGVHLHHPECHRRRPRRGCRQRRCPRACRRRPSHPSECDSPASHHAPVPREWHRRRPLGQPRRGCRQRRCQRACRPSHPGESDSPASRYARVPREPPGCSTTRCSVSQHGVVAGASWCLKVPHVRSGGRPACAGPTHGPPSMYPGCTQASRTAPQPAVDRWGRGSRPPVRVRQGKGWR